MVKQKRKSAKAKAQLVLELLRGKPIEEVSRIAEYERALGRAQIDLELYKKRAVSECTQREFIETILSASSRYDSSSVKGACVMALCEGRGIYLLLTGSDRTLSWRLRALMGHEIIVNNFLNWY